MSIFGRPVEPVACQQRGSSTDNPGMHAVAVELDLMRPVVAGRYPRHQLAQFRLDPLQRRRKVRDHVLRRGTDSTLHITHDANALQTADSISSIRIRSSGRVSASAARHALGGSCGLSPLPFRDATPGRQPLIMPGSTDAALAVKTERFPPYGLPPITAGAEDSAFDRFARSASVLNGHRGCQP